MTTTQLPVFRKMYDLNLMLIRLVNNFPKQYKYNVGAYLAVSTPITEIPDDDYWISCWVDLLSREHDYTQPFTSGQIIKCYCNPPFYPINNPQVIFE